MVLKQIQEENLLVKIAFVGPNLSTAVSYLEKTGSFYLVLSYTPSVLTIQHSLVPLMFGQCKDPLLQRDHTDSNCLYSANRLAKGGWSPIMNEAPRFFKFIQHFALTFEEYTQLLGTYHKRDIADNSDTDYENFACEWLGKKESSEDGVERTVFAKKLENIPLKGKHELYIGGIFPIMGKRYRAPELAQGRQWLR